MSTMGVEQVKTLLMIASQLSGYPIPQNVSTPVVTELTSLEMAKEACGATDLFGVLSCGVVGYFDPETGEIGVDFQAGTAPHAEQSLNAITVHELTHWLQHHNHPADWAQMCPERFLVEYEAYKTTVAYQITYEGMPIPEGFVVLSPTFCPTQRGTEHAQSTAGPNIHGGGRERLLP